MEIQFVINKIVLKNMELYKRLLLRFLRGAVATSVSTMVLLIPQNLSDIKDVEQWLMSLGIAGFLGFMAGGLLTLDKWFREVPVDK